MELHQCWGGLIQPSRNFTDRLNKTLRGINDVKNMFNTLELSGILWFVCVSANRS